MHSELMKALLSCLKTPKTFTDAAKDLGRNPKTVYQELCELEGIGIVKRETAKNPKSGRGQPKTVVVWAISSSATIESIVRMD